MLPEELKQKLYGQAPDGWKPILTYKFSSGAVAWAPGAQRGREPVTGAGVIGIGVWGGCVRNYSVGFNAQESLLTFIGIDVDGGNHADGNDGGNLAERVAAAVPEAYVRTSKSGLGAHAFLILSNPPTYPTKLTAQAAAKIFAEPYVARLASAGITVDKVGVNQLWVWSAGGLQRDVQAGQLVTWVAPAMTPVVASTAGGTGEAVPKARLGPRCRQIVETLERAGLIRTNADHVATRYMVHIKPVQEALCAALPWIAKFCTVNSPGTNLAQPNAIFSLRDGSLSIYSFAAGANVIRLSMRA